MKNFFKGYGNAINAFPSKKYPKIDLDKLNFPKNTEEALKRDWEKVSKDIEKSVKIIREEIQSHGRE